MEMSSAHIQVMRPYIQSLQYILNIIELLILFAAMFNCFKLKYIVLQLLEFIL